LIDTSAFKTAIIDLAVTGQLSTQFHADDSVEEITTALPPLSNKRKKLLGQSFEYGKKATLPDHWRWLCLGEISSYGDTPQKAYFDDVSGDTWILDLEDIRSGGQIIKKTRVHGKKFIGDKTVFSEGQVLYSKLRPYLKKVLVADEDGISTPELISFDTYSGVIPQYIVYCLLSSFTDRAIEKRSYGIKMPRIDAAFMVNLPIPVPPVSEQQFIVDRVQDAFSRIDTIDELQTQYADNLTVLKGKLIDAAIQGKLTEQLPEDGTAEELYQQIHSEKQALIAAGKIKKEKPVIDVDDVPHSIPDTWKWVRLGNIATVLGGKRIPAGRSLTQEDTGHKYIRVSEMKNRTVITDGLMFVPKDIYPSIAQYIINKEDVYITVAGTIGRVGKIPPEIDGANLTENADRIVFTNLDQDWLIICLSSSEVQKQIELLTTQVAQPKLAIKRIQEFLIPLPPLAEQKRIVQKLDEVLKMVDA